MSNDQKHWLSYSGLGIQIIVIVMVFLWLGKKFEEYFALRNPIGQLVGVLFGIFASLYNLIKSVK